jgi:hypothetical protein
VMAAERSDPDDSGPQWAETLALEASSEEGRLRPSSSATRMETLVGSANKEAVSAIGYLPSIFHLTLKYESLSGKCNSQDDSGDNPDAYPVSRRWRRSRPLFQSNTNSIQSPIES